MSERGVYDAPVETQGPVPAFKVIDISENGPFEKEVARFVEDKDTGERRLIKKTVQLDTGYMVVFPRGHSIFVATLDELEEKGFGEVVPLIRMNMESEVSKEQDAKTTKRVIEKVPAT